MAITNYAELSTSIADWLNRADLTSKIPDFITLAEADLNRSLRTRDMIVRDTATVSAQYTAMPLGFLKMKYLQLNTSKPHELSYRSPEQLRLERIRHYSVPGEPQLYTVLGASLELAPTPDTSYTAEMGFYKSIPALSAGVNWLITKSPDLYLYASLMHSAPYLKDDPRLTVWVQAYDRIMARIQAEDEAAERGETTPRVTLRRLG